VSFQPATSWGDQILAKKMHISIEKGKTLIIRLMAVGPVVEGRAQRDVWFEVNGEVGYISINLHFCLHSYIMVGPCGGYRGQKILP